jgi:hypothetical protein
MPPIPAVETWIAARTDLFASPRMLFCCQDAAVTIKALHPQDPKNDPTYLGVGWSRKPIMHKPMMPRAPSRITKGPRIRYLSETMLIRRTNITATAAGGAAKRNDLI